MSIRKVGRKWYVYDSQRDADGKRREPVVLVTLDKREAEAKNTELRLRRLRNEHAATTQATFRAYADRWLQDRAHDWKPRTVEGYRHLLEGKLYPVLGGIPLGAITPQQVQGVLRAMATHAPNTRRNTYRLLSEVLRHAVRQGALPSNPADAVQAPRVPRSPQRVLTQYQASALLAALPADDVGLLVGLALLTGLRRSELCGLQWADVDWANATLTVRRGVHAGRGPVHVTDPKTARSTRVVALPAEALALMRQAQAQARSIRAISAEPPRWLFTDAPGTGPAHPDRLGARANYWLRCWSLDLQGRAAKGKPSPISLHGLRHTQATLLIKAGVPVKVVSERLGHSTVGITLDIYTHVLPGMDAEAAGALSAALAATTPATTAGVVQAS